jgi:hypothetical protein
MAVPIRVYRAEDFPGAVTLDAEADGPLSASFDDAVLDGQSATSATMTVRVPPATPSGTYDVTVTADDGDRTRTAVARIRVDADAPVVGIPSIAPDRGRTFQTTSIPARARWSAATDAGSGVAAYQVGWRVNDGSWSVLTVDDAVLGWDRTLSTGRNYDLRVRARDAAGNWSAWATQSDYRLAVVQDTSSTLTRSGSWSTSANGSYSGGSAIYSRSKGASVSRSFTGRAIAWVAPFGPTRGSARIYVDDVLVSTVSLYRSSTAYRRIAYSLRWASSGTHRIRVEVVGTSGHPRVDVDAFVIIR